MNAIEIKKVTKAYKGFNLGPVDLVLPSGCITGLIGENGAGKSTLIKLIMGLVKADSGCISIFGKEGATGLSEIKQDIGAVLDEVGFPLGMNAKQVNRVLEKAYTNWNEEKYFELLKKLNVPEDKAFKSMSKGMKMKLGIACALSHNPKLLVLDEAMAGLDPVARDEMVDILLDFTRDESHTILISSHIVSDLEKLCDYIAFIHKGQISVYDEKDMLKEKYGIIRCSLSELEELDADAIVGKRVSSYGVEAIVKRCAIPEGMETAPVGIEELFVFMAKEDA